MSDFFASIFEFIVETCLPPYGKKEEAPGKADTKKPGAD